MASDNTEQPHRPGVDKLPGVTLRGPKDLPFEEHPNTENRDWRLRAITTLTEPWKSPTSGKVFPVGSIIGTGEEVLLGDKLIMMQAAHPAALYLSLAARLRDSAKTFISKNLQVDNFLTEDT